MTDSEKNRSKYSHLSNKRGAHNYWFWKIPPSTKRKSSLHVYWFHEYLPPFTFTLFSNHYNFQPPFLQFIGSLMTVFFNWNEVDSSVIRPIFALKVYIKVVFGKKIYPPRKNPPSTFMDFSKKFQPPRLFQSPRLLILPLLHPLHFYSSLHV